MSSILIPDQIWDGIIESVKSGYGVGERHYHTFDHALEVMRNVEAVHRNVGVGQPVELCVAALYHDICYVPGDLGNEDKSIIYMLADLKDTFSGIVDPSRVAFLIWCTKYHFKLGGGKLDGDEDAQIFLDCDIQGFAAPWKQFKAQNLKLEKEFQPLTKNRSLFLQGRIKFLRDIYECSGCFNSTYFKDRYERLAISNIATELEELERELAEL